MWADWMAPWGLGVAGTLLTYLLHSSVALGAAWLLTRTGLVRSPSASDALWKSAMVLGLITTLALGTAGLFRPADARKVDGEHRTVEVRRLARAPGPLDTQRSRLVAPSNEDEAGLPGGLVPGEPQGLSGRRRVAVQIRNPSPECRELLLAPIGFKTERVGPSTGSGVPMRERILRARELCASGPVAHWYLGLLVFWGLGVTVGAGRWWVAERALKGAVYNRRDSDSPGTRAVLDDVLASSPDLGAIRLTMSDALESPAVLGRREICIPPSALDLSDDQMRAVLAHELGHIARRDAWWSRLVKGIETVLFIQPLNRLAAGEIRDASEFLCDEWAVACTGSPMALARSLARVSSWLTRPEPATTLSMVHIRDGRLLRRVERILHPPPARPLRPAWGALLSFAAVSVLLMIPPVRLNAPGSISVATWEGEGAPADLAVFEAEFEAMAREGSVGPSAYVTFVTRESGDHSVRPYTPSP